MYIDLRGFKVGDRVTNNRGQTWIVLEVRRKWLKVRALLPPKDVRRFHLETVDNCIYNGWWEVTRGSNVVTWEL